eukprot:9533879-Ditylum_brightwellii.AAC.1
MKTKLTPSNSSDGNDNEITESASGVSSVLPRYGRRRGRSGSAVNSNNIQSQVQDLPVIAGTITNSVGLIDLALINTNDECSAATALTFHTEPSGE